MKPANKKAAAWVIATVIILLIIFLFYLYWLGKRASFWQAPGGGGGGSGSGSGASSGSSVTLDINLPEVAPVESTGGGEVVELPDPPYPNPVEPAPVEPVFLDDQVSVSGEMPVFVV